MAHEFETGFFVNTLAWHGLGTTVRKAPSIQDAIVMAGLDWEVRKEPLQIASDGRLVPDAYASVRSTDDSILGVVGPVWQPLQNRDAFAWFQPLVESGDVTLEAAGSLRHGQRVWMLAKAATAEVKPGDAVEQYVLLSNGHDGKLGVRIGFTTIRVVCMNTLKVAHASDASKLVRIQHSSKTIVLLENLRELMNVCNAEFRATIEQLKALAETRCTERDLRRYVREVFALPEPKPVTKPSADAMWGAALPECDPTSTSVNKTESKVVELFEMGRGAELSRGTMWGAYNAVSEFLTHEKGKDPGTRLNNQWCSKEASLINRALDLAVGRTA